MAALKPKVSSIVKTQFPDHIRGDDDMNGMVDFVSAYYQWMETPGNPNHFLQSVLEQTDIDTAGSTFADLHAKEFFQAYRDFKCDRKILVKNIKDYFVAKGSLPSLELLFNVLYDETPEVLWGVDMSLRTSSFETASKLVVEMKALSGDPLQLLGTLVYGENKAVSFVDRIYETTTDDQVIWMVELSEQRTSGRFNVGDMVWGYHREDYDLPECQRRKIKLEVLPIIGSVKMLDQGWGYEAGDSVHVYDTNIGSGGTGGRLSVKSVSTGKVEGLLINKAGTGYSVGDMVYALNSDAFEGIVSDVDGYGAQFKPIMKVNEYIINDGGFGFAVGDLLQFYPDNTKPDYATFKVTSVGASDIVTGVKATRSGTGYDYYTIGIYKKSDNTLVRRIKAPTLSTDSKGAIISASFTAFDLGALAAGDVYAIVNGDKGSVIAWRNGGTNAMYIESQGLNYVKPVCKVDGVAVNVTLTSEGNISSVALPGTAIQTQTITVVSVSGSTIVVSAANIGSIRTNYAITGSMFTGPVRIVDVSLNSTTGNYEITVSRAADTSSGATTVTLHKAATTLAETSGVGAVVVPVYRSGAITAMTIVDGGNITSIATPRWTTNRNGQGFDIDCFYQIRDVDVVRPGYNYTTPTLSVENGYGSGAKIQPLINDGVICYITLSDGGSGYYGSVKVSLSDAVAAIGSGFSAVAVVDELTGTITSIKIVDGGQDYAGVTDADIIITGSNTSPAVVGSVTVRDGAVRRVLVLDGGQDYHPTQSVTLVNTVGEPAPTITATFSVSIVKGEVISIAPLNRGEGYHVDSTVSLTGSQVAPVLSVDTITPTTIRSVSVVNGGEGYYPTWQITPLTLSVVDSTGTGAKLIPMIDVENGRSISGVMIVDGGDNYTNGATVSITGGSGSGATIELVITDGKITDAVVTAGGGGYFYGTKLHVIGDGSGAVLTPKIKEELIVLVGDSGSGYSAKNPPVLAITDLDGAGSGAIAIPVLTGDAVTAVKVIQHGSQYVTPSITVSNHNGGSGLTVDVVKRNTISGVTISTRGTKYRAASVYIQGDGQGAVIKAECATLAGIKDVTVTNAGSKFSNVPNIVAEDSSNLGAVSRIKVLKSLPGFKKIPQLHIDSTGAGAEVIALSTSIGRVLEVQIDHPGYAYVTPPTPVFPMVGIMSENSFVKPGELVYRVGYSYPMVNGKPNYLSGPHGYVMDVDFSRNLVKINDTGITFDIVAENGNTLVAEANGVHMVREGQLGLGSNVAGVDSSIEISMLRKATANGYINTFGMWKAPLQTRNTGGRLNSTLTRITNSRDVQDYAYTIKCGLDLKQIEGVVKQHFHPAGYYLWNAVKINTKFNVAMNYERATNKYILNQMTIKIVLESLLDRARIINPLNGFYEQVIYSQTFGDEPELRKNYQKTNDFVHEYMFGFMPVLDQVKEGRNASTTLAPLDGTGKPTGSGLDPNAATPIKNWLHMTIKDFEQGTDPYFSNAWNWARDSEVYIVRLPDTQHRVIATS